MRYLPILLLLSFAAPSHAQAPQDVRLMQCAGQYTYCHTDGSGDVYGRNTTEEPWRVLGVEPIHRDEATEWYYTYTNCIGKNKCTVTKYYPCLKKMEDAMRAMEKWIPRHIPRSMTFDEIDQKDMDWQQWDAAKQHCWRHP